jgi:hypothetical protein
MTDRAGRTFVANPSPWVPMSEPNEVRCLGKLLEELNECGSATARCLIQGIDECEPSTGEVNRQWLENEIADVLANIQVCIEKFGLVPSLDRIELKKQYLRKWHEIAP